MCHRRLPRFRPPGHRTSGPYYFPPIGASVAASGRLLLHLCRGAFEAAGGTVAYWDTDSLFIIATPQGGEIIPFAGGSETTSDGRPGVKALSFRAVHDIQIKIEAALSPYPENLGPYTYDLTGPIPTRVPLPALLKSEPENQPPPEAYGFPVEGPLYDGNRPKRHRIYHIRTPGAHIEIHDGTPVVVEATADELKAQSNVVVTNPSLHGITYHKPKDTPDDYIEQLMAHHLEGDLQIGNRERPGWADEMAISLVAATRIDAIDLHPDNRPYSRIAVATSLFGQQITDPEAVARLIRKHYHWPGAARLIAEKTGLSVRTARAILAGKKPSLRSTEQLWEFARQQRLFGHDSGRK